MRRDDRRLAFRTRDQTVSELIKACGDSAPTILSARDMKRGDRLPGGRIRKLDRGTAMEIVDLASTFVRPVKWRDLLATIGPETWQPTATEGAEERSAEAFAATLASATHVLQALLGPESAAPHIARIRSAARLALQALLPVAEDLPRRRDARVRPKTDFAPGVMEIVDRRMRDDLMRRAADLCGEERRDSSALRDLLEAWCLPEKEEVMVVAARAAEFFGFERPALGCDADERRVARMRSRVRPDRRRRAR